MITSPIAGQLRDSFCQSAVADGNTSLGYPLAIFRLAGCFRSLLVLTDVLSSTTAMMLEGLMCPIGDKCSACVYCSIPVSSLGGCSNIRILWRLLRLLTHLPDRFTICIEARCTHNYFLGHRYKACHHLGHPDVPIDANALQNVQGVHQAEDAHEQLSDLEAGQADVPQDSTFSARGDRTSAILIGWRMGWRAIPDSFRPQNGRTLCDERKSQVDICEGVCVVLVCVAP